jgi:hypothetical protein
MRQMAFYRRGPFRGPATRIIEAQVPSEFELRVRAPLDKRELFRRARVLLALGQHPIVYEEPPQQ